MTPQAAGMNAAKLDSAVQYAMSQASTSVRVFRYGCLVAQAGPDTPTQSFSLAKSIVSLTFGRAWTLGLIAPDDPLGSLIPKADTAHGALTMRQLLTMTEGLSLHSSHDLDLAMADRVRDLLTLPFVSRPGTTFAYFQSGPPTVTAAITAATGVDFQTFMERQLLNPIGIPPGTWTWGRDAVGTTDGFWDLNMRPEDYARLGELLQRGGVWGGRRLLSEQYVIQAAEPIKPFGCYGLFIWLNATRRCNWTRFLGLPPDMWEFNGAMGQLVTVFPSQGLMIVRTGAGDWAPEAGSTNGLPEREFEDQLLGAITDRPVAIRHPQADPGIPTAWAQQRQPQPGPGPTSDTTQPPLLPAGPWRARAVEFPQSSLRADGAGWITVVLRCPPRSPTGHHGCVGRLTSSAARAAVSYHLRSGGTTRLGLRLTPGATGALARRRSLTLIVTATDRDGTHGGTTATAALTLT